VTNQQLKFDPVAVKLPCDPVPLDRIPSFAWLAQAMLDLVKEKDGLGLAANQVGFNIQLILVHHPARQAAIFNPKITRLWGGLDTKPEGCLSAPGKVLKLVRHRRCDVTGFDCEGGAIAFKARGLLARVFQHEIDHMTGITIFDRFRLGTAKAVRL
jgi:peptide deformylase